MRRALAGVAATAVLVGGLFIGLAAAKRPCPGNSCYTASTTTTAATTTAATTTAPPPSGYPASLTVSSNIASGSTLSGSVKWAATPSASVSEVDFLIDGVQRWVEKLSPYQYDGDPSGVLDTTTLANGSHTLTAVAVTASGLRASAARTVNVSNATSVSSSNGSVLFNADWETDNTSQWTWGTQCANTGTASDYITRGNLYVVNDLVGQGNFAGRIDLPASGQRTACEGLRKRTLNRGGDDYYGMMFRLPTNWQEPSSAGWGLALAQLNYQLIWGPPIGLFAHGDHVSLVTQTGYCDDVNSTTPGCAYSSGPGGNLPQMYAVPSLKTGVWNELVIHVHWASDSSGVVEVWHRLKGETTWTKTVSFKGYPTIQWSNTQPLTNLNQTTSDKFGAYRGPSNVPLSIWQDGVTVGTSFAAAATQLP